MDKVRGVGVITILGIGKIISPKGCSKGIDHHRGREFPCVVGISVSRIFRVILHIRDGNSLPFGLEPEGIEGAQRLNKAFNLKPAGSVKASPPIDDYKNPDFTMVRT